MQLSEVMRYMRTNREELNDCRQLCRMSSLERRIEKLEKVMFMHFMNKIEYMRGMSVCTGRKSRSMNLNINENTIDMLDLIIKESGQAYTHEQAIKLILNQVATGINNPNGAARKVLEGCGLISRLISRRQRKKDRAMNQNDDLTQCDVF